MCFFGQGRESEGVESTTPEERRSSSRGLGTLVRTKEENESMGCTIANQSGSLI